MESLTLIYFGIVALVIVNVDSGENEDNAFKSADSAVNLQVDAKSGKMETDAIGFKEKADEDEEAKPRKYMKMLTLPKRSALAAFKNLKAKQENRQDLFSLFNSFASGAASAFSSWGKL